MIRRARDRVLEPDEKEWADRIEHRRAELETSTATIELELAPETVEFWRPRIRAEIEEGVELNGSILARRVASITRTTSKPREWGEFLLKLTRDLAPQRAIELGSSVGISAAYQAAGLRLAGGGPLITIEGRQVIADVASATLQSLGLPGQVQVGRFEEELPGLLNEPVGLAFIDGDHREAPTLHYHDLLWSALAPGGVLLYDDIAWSDEMKRAWKRIKRSVANAADLGGVGIVVRPG